jgi:outer membrane protein assembly factor BamA
VYGLGYQLRWDRRSNTLYPKRGFFLDFSQLFFAPEWGSDYRFTRYELELRKYWRPRWDPCGVIAAQFYSEMHTGTPPFRLTGLMGSSSHMRGYYQGRYRDRQYLAAQVEYRRPIFWRIEAAAFAGGGAVAPTLAALSPADLKPTYGAGLRFRFDQQNHGNIRLDYARGARGVSGFYASYGAAF